jgi:hypothetical protein
VFLNASDGLGQIILAASGVYHRHAEEEEEARKLVAWAKAMKWEEDAE